MNDFYINRESNTDNQDALLSLENCYIYQSNRLILKFNFITDHSMGLMNLDEMMPE